MVGLEEKLRVFEGEEGGVEDSVKGEQAEEKCDGFGEFEQHGQIPGGLSLYCLLFSLRMLCAIYHLSGVTTIWR